MIWLKAWALRGAHPSPMPSPAPRPLIAVVEEDPALLNALEFALGAEGYGVCGFKAARAALDSPAIAAADCLVIDDALRDDDGVSLLRRLRGRGVSCPAILMASHPSRRRRDAEAAGAALVDKPLIAEDLSARIRAALASP